MSWRGEQSGLTARRLAARAIDQPHVRWRLAASRLVLAPTIIGIVRAMPAPHVYDATAPLLASTEDAGRARPVAYRVARWGTVAGVGLWALTGRRRYGAAGSVAFGALGWLNAELHRPTWPYYSHLHWHLALLSTVRTDAAFTIRNDRDPRDATDAERVALAGVQAISQLVYLQAGVAKLHNGGIEWLRTGNTLAGSLASSGTPFGRRVAERRSLVVALSAASVVFELGFLPAMQLLPRRRRLVAALAIGFHGGTAALLDISFWHLWLQHVPHHVAGPRRRSP